MASLPRTNFSTSDTISASGRGSIWGFDWPLWALVVLLSVWGAFTVISATQAPGTPLISGGAPSDAAKQIGFVVLGLGAMTLLGFANYRWLMYLQGWLYWINLGALILVLFVGREVNGAKSWIFFGPISLQVSEFSKFALLLALSAFLTRRQTRIREGKTVALSLFYLVPPLLLILKQPDFGTAMAVLSIWFGIMFFGGARWQHLFMVGLIGTLLMFGAFKGGVLKPHQVARLTAFADPKSKDNYQLDQSLIAIGGGQLTGQGYREGMQNRANYVPFNQTDFIFTVVAEELGFLGGAILIGCYFLLLYRATNLALFADNYFGVLLCGGFTALLAFHCIINIGMTMRVMPITGVPLPFFSYGGSSFLAFSLCAGLLQSVSSHRR